MPDSTRTPPTPTLHRRLHMGLLYALLGAAVVALLSSLIRGQIRDDVKLIFPPGLGPLTAELTERRELLVERLGVLQHLSLAGSLPATDYLAAQAAYSRVRARHEGCIDWMLLTLETENAIPEAALDCLRTEPEIPAALTAERISAALEAAVAAGPGQGSADPAAPHPQYEYGGQDGAASPGAGLAEIIELERRLRDAALAQEAELDRLRARTRGPLALQIERWRWPPARAIAPVAIPLGGHGAAALAAGGFEEAVDAVRRILKNPRGHDPHNYAGRAAKWLDTLVSHADDAIRLREFLAQQGPARKADRIDSETANAFPGLVDALQRLERAAQARTRSLTAAKGAQ